MTRILATDIEKPLVDDRQYRYIVLENGLEALLISDANTDKEAAALDVHVGYYFDPENIPGLAHFLEHLLFMGTEKYPNENDYIQFITAHGGHHNAFTTAEHTNYYFEVAAGHLRESLDRFSQFFIAPLFSAACKDREILAVESENRKNLQNDDWRSNQLSKLFANREHPYHKFSTGNYDTLGRKPVAQGIDVRTQLIQFYKTHYSSNFMKLVVLSKGSLDELENWVENLFSQVSRNENARGGALLYPPLFKDTSAGNIIYSKPVMDTNHLEILFNVPDQQLAIFSNPGRYYSHLLGHESKGSILYYFKERQWAHGLACGTTHVSRQSDLFIVDIELTRKGLDHWREMVYVVFAYLELLKAVGPQKWVFDELATMSRAKFLYAQKQRPAKTASSLAFCMHHPLVEPSQILTIGVLKEFNENLLREFAEHLHARNARFMLSSQSLSDLNQHEEWYGTEYRLDHLGSLDNEVKQFLGNSNLPISLPEHNSFVPDNFRLLESSGKAEHPQLVLNDKTIRVWHKQDTTFLVPKATISVRLTNPSLPISSRQSILNNICVDLLRDELNDQAYYAETAGLSYDLMSFYGGMSFEIVGFNEKLVHLALVIAEAISKFQPTESRYNVIREKTERRLHNWDKTAPYLQLPYIEHSILATCSFTIEEKLSSLKSIEFSHVEPFLKEFRSGLAIEVLTMGNMTSAAAIDAGNAIRRQFPGSATIPLCSLSTARKLLRPADLYCTRKLSDSENSQNAISFVLEIGEANDLRQRTALAILGQIVKEPVFDRLRTKEQLGYVVDSSVRPVRSQTYLRIYAQSEERPAYLEQRIEALIQWLRHYIDVMSEQQFKAHVSAVVSRLLEKPKNLEEESAVYWGAVVSGYYDFGRLDKMAQIARDISKADIVQLYNDYVTKGSSKRAKLAIHLEAAKAPPRQLHTVLPRIISRLLVQREIHATLAEIGLTSDDLRGLPSHAMSDLIERRLTKYMAAGGVSALAAEVIAVGEAIVSGNDSYFVPDVESIKDIERWRDTLELATPAQPRCGEFKEYL